MAYKVAGGWQEPERGSSNQSDGSSSILPLNCRKAEKQKTMKGAPPPARKETNTTLENGRGAYH